jgi:hypothetical protein
VKLYKRLPFRLFWMPKGWSDKRFGFEYCPDMLGGVLYAGVVVFGRALVYSTEW